MPVPAVGLGPVVGMTPVVAPADGDGDVVGFVCVRVPVSKYGAGYSAVQYDMETRYEPHRHCHWSGCVSCFDH